MFAYFDAGTGSMIASFFVAGFAGIAVFGKAMMYRMMFWRKAPENLTVNVDDTDLDLDIDIEEID